MGCKYMIHYAKYPYKGYYEGDWQGNNIISFLFNLAKLVLRYEIVDAEFRAFERMDRIEHAGS